MAEAVASNLSGLVRQVEVERALVAAGIAVDNGLGLNGGEDVQTVSSNSDEYVTIYGTLDGEPRRILRIDARRLLTKRLTNGKPAFWIPEMGGEPPYRMGRGEIRCYLDPEFDESDQYDAIDRAWIDSIGLRGRTCNMMAPDKNNQRFISVFDRDDHMAKKHRREWATIQARLTRQREEAKNSADRETREAMMAMARAASSAVAPTPETPAPAPAKAAK